MSVFPAPGPAPDEEPSWRSRALCADPSVSPDIFYPSGESALGLLEDRYAIEESKAICEACPVREECLTHALANREPHGTWGGMTEWERRRLLKGRAVQMSMSMV